MLSSLRQRVKFNAAIGGQASITFTGMIFSQVATFLAVYLMAKSLGPAGLGRYQLFMGVALVASFAAKLGLDEGLSYYLPRQGSRYGMFGMILTVIGVAVGAGLVLGGLIAAFAPSLNMFVFGVPGFDLDLPFLSVLLPCYILLLLATAALRGLGRSDLRAYVNYFGVGGVFVGGLLVLSKGQLELSHVLWLRSLVLLALGLFGIGAVAVVSGVSLRGVDKGRLRDLFSISLVMVPVGLLQYLADQPFIDLIIVGRVGTPEEVGVYSVASRVGALVLLPLNALSIVLGPAFSKAVANGELSKLKKLYEDGARWLIHLTVLAGGLLTSFSTELVAVFGNEFGEGAQVLRIFAVGYGVSAILGLNSAMMLANGLQKVELRLGVLTVLAMLGSDVVLGSLFGMPGVAVGTVGALSILGFVRYGVVRSRMDMAALDWRELSMAGSSCVLASIVTWMLMAWLPVHDHLITKIVVGGSVMAIIHACIMWLLWSQRRRWSNWWSNTRDAR